MKHSSVIFWWLHSLLIQHALLCVAFSDNHSSRLYCQLQTILWIILTCSRYEAWFKMWFILGMPPLFFKTSKHTMIRLKTVNTFQSRKNHVCWRANSKLFYMFATRQHYL